MADPAFDPAKLQPKQIVPVPLPSNFAEIMISKPPGAQLEDVFQMWKPNESRNLPPQMERIADEILNENEERINQAAAQVAASRACNEVNRDRSMFEDLTPISFDEEAFIQDAERAEARKREVAARRVLRRSH